MPDNIPRGEGLQAQMVAAEPADLNQMMNDLHQVIIGRRRRNERIREEVVEAPREWGRVAMNNFVGGLQTEEEDMKTLNPEDLVKTVDGSRQKVSDCAYYNGEYYYKIHKDVRTDAISGEIYHFKNCMICHTAIKIVDGKAVFTDGYVNPKNKHKLIPVMSHKYNFETLMSTMDNIEGWSYKESLEFGKYVDVDFKEKAVDKVTHYDVYKNYFGQADNVKTKIITGRLSPSYAITEGLRYTFGVELECSRGYLPYWLAARKYNLLCIRDGSINGGEGNAGPEYVTGIMTGDTGLAHLQEICQELAKRTRVNETCGVHVHIGNINFDKYFLINSYRLALFLEDEIFATLPKSRRENQYCRRLKPFKFKAAIPGYDLMNVEQDYNTLFKYISYEKTANPSFDYNKKKQHPLGAKCGYNHDTPRYCWLNYVPAMFNTRNNGSYSLEIRNHSGTTNFNKIRNWTLFFMAFCAFAEQYPHLINESITMAQVFEKVLPKKAKSLTAYFNSRKELFHSEPKEFDEELDAKKSIKELINN